MMGQQAGNQERLFYSFNLEEHVPADHLLRGIDRFLDLSALRQRLAPFYSQTGRPSIDPEADDTDLQTQALGNRALPRFPELFSLV